MADDSLEFRQAISPGPSTRDTMPSLMTGAYPTQFTDVGLPERGVGPPTLPERLADFGFTNAGFSHNNFISRRYNHDRGFHYYVDDSAESRKAEYRGAWRIKLRNAIEDTRLIRWAHRLNSIAMEKAGRSLFLRELEGNVLTSKALEWLEGTNGKRFLWLHYMDTHYPYTSPESVQSRFGRTFSDRRINQLSEKTRSAPNDITPNELEDIKYLYDCSIHFVDEQIGRVLDYIQRSGIGDDSIIVVSADHGEAFGEHGGFGHPRALWDELIRVPLLVNHPEYDPMTVEGQIPLRLLSDSIVDGTGWFDLLHDGLDFVISEVAEFRGGKRSCRGQGFKLIDDGSDSVYTRYTDGDERIIDRSKIPDEIGSKLRDYLEMDRDPIRVEPDIDEEELKADLEALGYLQ